MAKEKKAAVPNPMSAERKAEIDAETQKSLESARITEEKRRENSAATQKNSGLVSTSHSKTAPKGIPNFVGKTADPKAFATPAAKPRRKTRSGKKIDKTTGKLADIPRAGTMQKRKDGTLQRVTKEENKELRTTDLGKQKRPTEAPKPGGLKEIRGAREVKKGFSTSYPIVESATKAAMHHLGNMRATQGTDEFHQHHESFNLIHANIGKMSPELHTSLGQARHEIMHPSGKTDGNLALIHKAVSARLAIGRAVHTDNLKRATEGNPK